MGRKLDLSGLTENEAEHVLKVVQRDMKLRKTEEERLSELRQELDEEGSRCLLLSRQSCFNQRCCIRCCLPFTFLLNPKRQCRDCRYNVCKACRVYNKREKAWLCSACQKSRLLKTQSLEWFYTNVKRRFKRFGSAKVLKTLYKKHLAEHSALSELTEGSAYEESICNEGSVCGSDSTFYRQSEEHSMAETLTVALRVAEEAVDEAIAKAEFDTTSQEKQNEANYLRAHRGELVEELAKTIVQKIISRRKTLAEMGAKYDQDWPLEQNPDPHLPLSACEQASSSLTHQPGLWRSHSALSLLHSDPPGLIQDSLQALKKEGIGSSMSTWKSVDRLDNAVLKSPDGNWIALQSAQLSRPSLLTKRKSLVYSALERESGVVSAYEGMGSDNETKPEPDSSWGAVLQEIHRKMTDSNFNTQDRTPSPLLSRRGSKDNLFSDSEGNWKSNKPLLTLFKKVPAEIRRPSSSRRTSIIDVNFNVEGAGEEWEESSVAPELEAGKVRKSRKKRKKAKEKVAASSVADLKDNQSHLTSDAVTSDTLTSGVVTPEPFDLDSDTSRHKSSQMDEEVRLKLQRLAGHVSGSSSREEEEDRDRDSSDDGQTEERKQGSEDRDDEDERSWRMDIDVDERRTEDERDVEVDDEELKFRLYRVVAQSRLTYFSTDDELDKTGQSEGEWDEDMEDKKEQEDKAVGLTHKLCQLEREVRATQFSSTEDELDRVGVDEKTVEEAERKEELAAKVCRLANQVNATQFSSTDDELDRAGRGEDEAADEETLWKLQAEKAIQAAQLRDLASLVSASQFSSTEDELDRVEKNEGEGEREVNDGGIESDVEMEEVWRERTGSFGRLDVTMFDLRGEIKETKCDNSDEKVESVIEDTQQGETEGESLEETATEEIVDELTGVEQHMCGDAAEKETDERHEVRLTSVVEAESIEEITNSNETRGEQENQSDAKWPDEREGEKVKESKEDPWRWEATAESEEEEAEFNRIISSMLMMTLEDMQVGTGEDRAAESGRVNRELEDTETQGGVKTEGDLMVRNGNEQRKRDQRKSALGTNEMVADEEEEDGGGEAATERRVTEPHRGAAEGERESKETEESCAPQEGPLSPREIQSGSDPELCRIVQFISTLLEQRYSAVSLRSITTEVLKVLNATEELLQGVGVGGGGGGGGGGDARLPLTSLPPNSDPKKLDQQFSRLEENVYVAAGSVYSLEAELSDLEECARGICSSTSDMELSFLEEQVASAAAKVQQSELQICDISARIAALKSAGLNVDTQSHLTKTRTTPVMPITLDSSRQQRRRLPAPPVKEDKET